MLTEEPKREELINKIWEKYIVPMIKESFIINQEYLDLEYKRYRKVIDT